MPLLLTQEEFSKFVNSLDDTLVISLDYDGCGDILFSQQNSFLKNFLLSISANRIIEFYSNSNRQTRNLDQVLGKQNKNGFSLENFRKLCAAMKWNYNPLLLTNGEDIENYMRQQDEDALVKVKLDIINAQLNDAAKKFPNKKISFVFIDDYALNIKYICNNLKLKHPNITVHIIQDSNLGMVLYRTFAKENKTLTRNKRIKNRINHLDSQVEHLSKSVATPPQAKHFYKKFTLCILQQMSLYKKNPAAKIDPMLYLKFVFLCNSIRLQLQQPKHPQLFSQPSNLVKTIRFLLLGLSYWQSITGSRFVTSIANSLRP